MEIRVWGLIPINRNQFILLEAIMFVFFFLLTVFFFWYKFPAYIDDPMILFYAKYLKFAALIATFLVVVEAQFYLNIYISKQKDIIEQQNSDLKQQKQEILAQKEELKKQKDFAEQQFEIISQQKKEITESITYASRIQKALLPNDFSPIAQYDYFILYRPKEIVSGDFYWFTKKADKTIIVAADCTGHGVPGAFMSVLGITYLNDILNRSSDQISASEILERLREKIINTFKTVSQNNDIEDGMDIALFIIENNNNLQFAGANNPLFIIRKKDAKNSLIEAKEKIRVSETDTHELIHIKGDATPIGISRRKSVFNNINLPIQKGDCLYAFSDGILDQFGGRNSTRFGTKRFKELLLNIQNQTMNKQKTSIENTLDDWIKADTKLNLGQIDDIMILGIRV